MTQDAIAIIGGLLLAFAGGFLLVLLAVWFMKPSQLAAKTARPPLPPKYTMPPPVPTEKGRGRKPLGPPPLHVNPMPENYPEHYIVVSRDELIRSGFSDEQIARLLRHMADVDRQRESS